MSTFTVIYSDWHTSLSLSAHQTLPARDFTDNGNKALSFSIDNVIAIGNEAIKMAIKVLILLPFSRIWPFVMPVFLHALRQELRDFSLYLFKIKRSVQQQAGLTGCFGICRSRSTGPWGKVREWELSSLLFSSSLCQRGPSPETPGQKQESYTKGENSNQQSGTLVWPTAWPTVSSPPYSILMLPFGWFWLIGVVLFCLSVAPFSLPGSRDHISCCIPKTLIVILLLSGGKNIPEADRRQSTIHPPDPG